MIVSLDRKMGIEVMDEILGVIEKLVGTGGNPEPQDEELMKRRRRAKRIVGIDLCGDPLAGDVDDFKPFIARAKALGLGVTVHIAETTRNTPEETLKLLSLDPDRLGHATFLNNETTSIVLEKRTCIEICLSSNLLCKTVSDLETHHIHQYLKSNHPIAICTDDILPFRTSLLGEYALLLAQPPLGLGLSELDVRRIAAMGQSSRFYK